MKVKEILTEIRRLKVSAAEYHYSMYPPDILSWKPLPGGSDLVWAETYQGDRLLIFIAEKIPPGSILKNDSHNLKKSYEKGINILGVLETSKTEQFQILDDSYQVDNIFVVKQARNRGIGKSLYGVFLSILKHTLISGADQTAAGRRAWLNLSQIPNVEIKGVIYVDDKHLGPSTEKDMKILASTAVVKADAIIDSIMHLGGEFLGKDGDVFYFGFDVVPGTGELKAAVKNQLSNIYVNDTVRSPVLFARWNN